MAKKKADPTVKKRLKAGRVAALDLLIEEGGGGGTAVVTMPEFDPDKGVSAPDFESADDFNVERILNESGEASIPVDLKFDDSSMPTAKNFFEWVSSSNYLAATPYLEQALIGIRLFAEYCPNPSCSDTEWMQTENHEPSEGIVGLLNKVTLLEHGVCPKCGAKRSMLFKKRKLNLYNELAVCAGQRCVTGNTLLTTDMGLRRVRDLPVNGDDSVMSDLNVMLNNKACRVHKVLKDTDCNRLVAANLSNGMSLRGTADHGVEGWAFSYRPLSDCGRSPIVVNLGTHDSKPFPTKEFVLGLHAKYKTSGVVTRGAHFSCGEDFMLPVIADLAKGNVRVVGNRPYLDGDGVTLSRNIVLQHLVAAHMRDGVLAELPDYVLTQPRETLAVFFASLFELGEVTVVSEQLARDIQVLAVGCNQPIVREGCTLIRDREAYDDFSPLAETVQRVCPEFAPSAWDRATLIALLADVQESDPLYYLKRLVDGKFAVFTAEVEHIEPEPVWTFEVPSGQRYVSNGMVSENSGKSIVVAMLSTYVTHLLLKVQKPTRLFNVGDNQILHGTFVALTLAQAKDTLWDPYYGYLLDSPWFQRYHALIRRLEALHGVEVLKLRDTFVLYRHRNLYVYAAGPDKRVLRGRTRFLAAIDEIGYFDNNAAAHKVKTGAAEVHIALERSLLTVRANEQRLVDEGYDNLLTGYMLNVSSPSDYRDKICELVRLSQSSRKILGIHAPTWKMNPHIPRDNEIIVDAFQRDPMTAARDYGAQPPVSASPFISPVVVNDTMREVGRNEVEYTHQINRASNAGIQERTIYGVVTRIKETDVPSVLAIDAGETNNSFALSCTSTRDGMASIDLLIEIMPAPGVALNYTMIFDYLIVPVIKARNVRILLADRWNSTKLLQDALATSLVDVSKKYSLKYNDMWDVKNQMQGGTLSYPRSTHVKSVTDILNSDLSDYPECFKGRPVEHFMYQCVTIQDSRNQVLKGQGLTDDLWRATALSVYGLNNPDWAPFLVPRKNTNMNRDPSRLMVMGAGQRTAGGGSSVATKSGEVGNFACVAGSRRLKR